MPKHGTEHTPDVLLETDIVEFYLDATRRLGPMTPANTLIGLTVAHGLICLGASIEASARTVAAVLQNGSNGFSVRRG